LRAFYESHTFVSTCSTPELASIEDEDAKSDAASGC
jgi:hypothetical protein